MHRVVAASVGLCLVPALLPAQGTVTKEPTGSAQAETGFPVDLIAVKGGKMTVGQSADALADITKAFQPTAPRPRQKLLQKLTSELGEMQVDVPDFYLHRYLVTNEQYLQFVESAKPKPRFPFHWWKFGRKDDHEAKRDEYRNAFKGQEKADLLYWESYWDKLPYAIPKGEEQHPVVFVSWIDAQAFAGWAGMRLPAEAEWIWAATQGQRKAYLWGDQWEEAKLKELKLYSTADRKLKPVGALGAVVQGPLGHEDIVGNAWEWMGDVGFFPLNEAAYRKEIEKVRKFKWLESTLSEPEWSGARRVLKGGSYFSWSNPDEFRIGTRAHMTRTQTVEGASFRVAKTRIPARDMCRSRLAVEYDPSVLGGDRSPNLDDQIGIERYDLSPDGRLIRNYHAIAMVPVSHMALDKNAGAETLKEMSRERLLLAGILVTTESIELPKLEPGIYTVYFRDKGMAKELREALADAARELKSAPKERKEDKKPKEEGEPQEGKKDAKGDWRSVLAKHGLTEADVKGKHDKVRLKPNDFEVTTEEDLLVFRNNLGEFVAAMPTEHQFRIGGSAHAAELAEGSKDSKETWTFKISAPWDAKTKSRSVSFTIPLQMPGASDLSKPWRKPNVATNQGPTPQVQGVQQARNSAAVPSEQSPRRPK